MEDYKPRNHRHSIRLPAFDYAEPGLYFVTICTNDKKCLFGEVVDEKVILNEWGYIVKEEILKTEQIRKNVLITAWMVMPNHVHLIINIRRRGTPLACPGVATKPADTRGTPTACPYEDHLRSFGESLPNTISSMISQFKSVVTKRICAITRHPNAIWQRNYYERIIQTDEELFDTIEYIKNNPRNWGKDALNPV